MIGSKGEQLYSFNLNKKQIQDTIYSVKCGVASFTATYIAGVLHPLDLIKTRFQSHDGKSNAENVVPKYEGLFKGLRDIYVNQGFKGLYKGFYISLLSQALATAFFFLIYERRKLHYQSKGLETMTTVAFASIEASLLATIITQPIWVIKTRMLLNTSVGMGEIEHAREKMAEIYRQAGIKGFAKGLSISILLSTSGVLQMYIYEGSRIAYEALKIPQSIYSQKNFLCGSISKFVSILMTYPFTTVRTRVQQNQFFGNRTSAKYESVRDISKRLIKEQGISGFYKGLLPNLIKGIPQRGLYFYIYQLLKTTFIDRNTCPS